MLQLILFQSDNCSVCHAIEPKIKALCSHYLQVNFCLVKAEESPEICGQNRVFSFPVILLFNNNKEIWRKQGAMGMTEISNAIEKAIASTY